MSDVDEQMIRRAVELGRQGAEAGAGGPFGAVVARGAEVLGEGHNAVVATNDPTAHAEMTAIRAASQALGQPHLTGTVLYTSCEPCPMCAGAAMWARVDRVVFASTRDDAREFGRFDDDAFWDDLLRPVEDRELEHSQVGRATALEVWQWFAEHHADLHY
ncbi:nucleoside deaminase [Aquihabitans daechungensis]|uniref:nucleoside deaminase n=1 Tax=Aquihabitans daechungensis TaxID=1052257 RepID=UPI003B9E174D